MPVALIIGDVGAAVKALGAAGAPNAFGAAGLLKPKLAPPILPLAENPPLAGGVVGLGLTVGALLAASRALALRSLSPPANIIPDNVPVKNVAIGIINSKNF